jgi:low affinity Fe/Cu permease
LTTALGSVPAIIFSIALILLWMLSGPLFGYSDTWQLVINTSTTIITFNMVFIIQNTTNRESRAMNTKLDDIILALKNTRNDLVGLEDSSEKGIAEVQQEIRRGKNT